MDEINTELFIHSPEEIPDSYVKFSELNPIISNCNAIPDTKMYFYLRSNHTLNICQPIEEEHGIDINRFAYFLPHYRYYNSLSN